MWAARDALVLKALAWLLAASLPLSSRCTHLKGHGGASGAIRAVWAALPANRPYRSFTFRCSQTPVLYVEHLGRGEGLEPLGEAARAGNVGSPAHGT